MTTTKLFQVVKKCSNVVTQHERFNEASRKTITLAKDKDAWKILKESTE